MDLLQQTYPDASSKRLLNWQAQLWAFLHTIAEGDLVVLPLKTTSAVAIGEVAGGYNYRGDLPPSARHTRPVKWLKPDLPRTAFGQDLLYSLGAFMTVCEVKRHDAARRLAALARTGQDPGWAETARTVWGSAPGFAGDRRAGQHGFPVSCRWIRASANCK